MNKIAVLSNVTMDLVLSGLRKEFLIYTPAGFDTWQQEVLNPDSDLYQFSPDAVYVILYIDAYHEDWQQLKTGREHIHAWLDTLRFFHNQLPGTPMFVSSLDIREVCCGPVSEHKAATEIEGYWMKGIEGIENTYVFPLKECIADLGRNAFYSSKMWYLGNVPYSRKGSEAVAELIRRSYFHARGSKKKCLAVDLDNTLWGGVIGEEGVDGISLASHKEGGRYYDLQKCLKRMKENGVMLAVISKNNPEDVAPVFRHPYMVLKEEDFVGQKINWKPKPENMKELAAELNIGLDSFVFLDDNPAEREQMRSQCPQVEVIEFPQDTTLLPQVMEEVYDRFFKALYVTKEDLDKTRQYRRQIKRKEAEQGSASLADYLEKLEIAADIHRMRQGEKNRVVQLAGKTNQFNTTTVRYDEKQIEELGANKNVDVVVAQMRDRFGDEGLTAVVVVRYEKETAWIEDFIMSCRVMGRQLEYVIFQEITERIRQTRPEIERVKALYRRTAKNKPVESLYDSMGFSLCGTAGRETEVGYEKVYEIRMKDIKPFTHPYKEVHTFEKEG